MSVGTPGSATRSTRNGRCSRCPPHRGDRGKVLTGPAVNEMIKRRAADAGFTATQIKLLGGHSLRAGFVTEGFRAGADAHAIMRQTGHKSTGMLEVYAREHAPLVGNAVTKIGLVMTPAAAAAPPTSNDNPNASTRAAYLAAWQLFADWCQAAGASPLPADPGPWPSSCGTAQPRLPPTAAGSWSSTPGIGRGVHPARTVHRGTPRLGRRRRSPPAHQQGTSAVEAALRLLPNNGWTRGMFGRRDRCLLVLSQDAGISYQQLASADRRGRHQRAPAARPRPTTLSSAGPAR